MDIIRETLENIENLKKSVTYINESENVGNEKDETNAIPYTMQDELMSSILQAAKAQFGASFSDMKNPMLYYPSDGDVTLSGTIPGLGGDVKFQFRYKDASGNGCFIWSNYLVLSDATINTLKRVNGVYKNWKQSLDNAEDIKPMKYKNNASVQRGDDID